MADDMDLNAEPYRSAALLGVITGELRRMGYPKADLLDQLVDGLLDRVQSQEAGSGGAQERLVAWAELNKYVHPERTADLVLLAVRGAGLVVVDPAEITELRRELKRRAEVVEGLKQELAECERRRAHDHARAEGYY